MEHKIDLLGAITAHIIFISSILTFLTRIFFNVSAGHWIGIPILLMGFPLGYLLITAPDFKRPSIYYIQVATMLGWLMVLFLVDYVFKFDFRETIWMVISYVVFYFAGLGGMIAISARAGKHWAISAVILFYITAVLAFVQRAITGL